MKYILFLFISTLAFGKINAQQFIDKASIEYEVKTSIKKTMWNNDSWEDMIKDKMSDFKIGYYSFTFADNKSIYKFDRWDEKVKIPAWYKEGDEDNAWYFDFTTSKFNMNKSIRGSKFVIDDSIPVIEWKLTNENRQIAGFNCRKAVGKVMDSVYVFAFYTDEITISGGPCSISGLPGMILGLTIPRMYTSYLATKVTVNGVNVTGIKPANTKKMYTTKDFRLYIEDKIKDWYTWGDDKEENNRQKSLALWGFFL